jgi:hypothetical protein
LTPEFLFEEWDELVNAWNVTSGEAYPQAPPSQTEKDSIYAGKVIPSEIKLLAA